MLQDQPQGAPYEISRAEGHKTDAEITVLMTVLNGMPYLVEAVESILQQTFRDFRFLIVDNGSTDGTGAYLDSLNDPRLDVVHLAQTIERTAVLNYGLQKIASPLTCILDADDIAEPQRLEKQRDYMREHNDISLLACDVFYINSQGATFGQDVFQHSHQDIIDNLPLYNQFAHAACCFRTSAAAEVGGYPADFLYAQDLGLWVAMLQKGCKAANLPEFLARIRVHAAQETQRTERKKIRDMEQVRLAHAFVDIPEISVTSKQAAYMRAAFLFAGLGEYGKALKEFFTACSFGAFALLTNRLVWKRVRVSVGRKLLKRMR